MIKNIKYLQKLKNLNVKIEQKKLQLEDLKSKMESVGAIRYDGVRVKNSNPVSSVEKLTIRYVDLEAEISQDIMKFQEMKDRIINEIHQIEDSRYVEILFKRYVEYKTYELIAVEMNYSYDYVRTLHKRAVGAFSKNAHKSSD